MKGPRAGRRPPQRALVDPDPSLVTGLIFAGVQAAAAVILVLQQRGQWQAGEVQKFKKALLEASLALNGVKEEVAWSFELLFAEAPAEFAEDLPRRERGWVSPDEVAAMRAVLEQEVGFGTSVVQLSPNDLKRFKTSLGKIGKHCAKLHTASIDMFAHAPTEHRGLVDYVGHKRAEVVAMVRQLGKPGARYRAAFAELCRAIKTLERVYVDLLGLLQ